MMTRSRPSSHRALLAAAVLFVTAPLAAPPLAAPPLAAEIAFRRATDAWDVHFRHHKGASGRYYFLEIAGSGVATLDYDGDGDLDLFLVDSGALPGYDGPPGVSRLLRNDPDAAGRPRFVDLTAESGIAVASYGMGVAAGDLDGDGDLDLVVTGSGRDQAFRNRGDGTFEEIAGAGLDAAAWSTGAALADADGDGDLDLYVARYSDIDWETPRVCRSNEHGAGAAASEAGRQRSSLQTYCHPTAYPGIEDRFYRNRGDGTFVEATAAAGFAGPRLRGLGVVWADFDDDGAPDLYVANDTDPNLYFRGRGDGTFEEMALLANVAVSDTGAAEGGMGVAVADVDGDLRLDLLVTNFEYESNALYVNAGEHLFFDQRYRRGIAERSLPLVGFGTALADLDDDGDDDLVVVNGHVLDNIDAWSAERTYRQPDQVFAMSDGRFHEVRTGIEDPVRASRGLAVGDLDLDLDLDLVVTSSDDVAEVWENVGAGAGRALELDLAMPTGERHGVGSRAVVDAGERRLVREVAAGGSYLSQHDLTLHFGTGEATRADLALRLRDGRRLRVTGLPTGRRHRLVVPAAPTAPATATE